ncbi:EAL domain protein, partial [Vibrio parahaemolyticus V-223/04]
KATFLASHWCRKPNTSVRSRC